MCQQIVYCFLESLYIDHCSDDDEDDDGRDGGDRGNDVYDGGGCGGGASCAAAADYDDYNDPFLVKMKLFCFVLRNKHYVKLWSRNYYATVQS